MSVSLSIRSVTYRILSHHQKLFRFSKAFASDKRSDTNVFDRLTKRRQRNWAASQSDHSVYDYLKEEVAYRVSDRIYDVKKFMNVGVDLGCGFGYIAPHIYKEHVGCFIQADMSENMVVASRRSEEVNTFRVVGDEETVPFRNNFADLIVSANSMHWINDLPGFLRGIFSALREDGVFIGGIFGGDTLFQLRCSVQLAEMERLGGLAPHVSPFVTPEDVSNLMQNTGFGLITIDVDEIIVNYPDVFALMYDLKGMAESAAAWIRAKTIRRDVLNAAAAIYRVNMTEND
ncbi:unnamed protein product [Soboliphyme baturini]|uniref:Arginine-hydroxylase NDUFAF5, mitochondrial n=1 Tax=Soboliphyme baturini TaxID=241478 RepID=A0A183IS94_9BILA|nr:unnamed protein product [Soboliphyme baturini]